MPIASAPVPPETQTLLEPPVIAQSVQYQTPPAVAVGRFAHNAVCNCSMPLIEGVVIVGLVARTTLPDPTVADQDMGDANAPEDPLNTMFASVGLLGS